MNSSPLNKANVLAEALPYIRAFSGKTIVIKYGGAAMGSPDLQEAVMCDIAMMKFCGMNPVVVHGGGPEISALCKKVGIEPEFVDGLRVTDKATMEIVQMALVGKTNRSIVSHLNRCGVRAMGLSGQDDNLIRAKKRIHKEVKTKKEKDLGFVGDITKINSDAIEILIRNGFVPIIAPVGIGENYETYNINADSAAGEIAAALKAEKLVFLTDVEGIYADKNDLKSFVSHINIDEAKIWINRGKLDGGMIPKMQACFKALEAGAKRVHIIDGRVPHSMLLEVFTDKGIGTMVVK